MSFQPSHHHPRAFDPTQRTHEDSYWRSNRHPASGSSSSSSKLPGYGLSQSGVGVNVGPVGGGVSNKLSGLFETRDRPLPMYKDKPYFAPRRTGPRFHFRRTRALYGVLCLVALGCVWWLYAGQDGGLRRRVTSASLFSSSTTGERSAETGRELYEWMQSLERERPWTEGSKIKSIDWDARREKVKDAFIVSWDGYETHAWGFDEYSPVSKRGRHMVEGGMGWIIVDALDTLMIMNLTSRVRNARHWIHNSLRYNQDHDVNTFETTIRMLGGLLSAHYLSTTYPDLAPIRNDDAGSPGEDLYIEKATDLADRLLWAFDSGSGIPFASVNLNRSIGMPSHADGGASSTAEATTLQLEFKYLAKLTGEPEYWTAVEKVMEVVDGQAAPDGLVPIFIYADTGKFRGDNIRLGSRGDSYYEYLIKQYLQTSKQEPIYKDMWDEALMGVRKHLVTYTKNARLSIIAERPNGIRGSLSPKMDHLVCFMPGTIALGATGGQPLSEARKSADWSMRRDEEILLAKELMKTCWATYVYTKTGLSPEITYFNIDDPPRTMTDMFPDSTMTKGDSKSREGDLPLVSGPLYPLDDETLSWRQDIDIHAQDRHNLQRPETVESLFYMYRITGDETYRHWGWEMFKSFIRYTAVIETDDDQLGSPRITGFTSLSNADTIPPVQRDNMESFWLAETLKYFYLLFSDRDFIPLEETVFNTEAHPLPRFELGGDLRTGWTRKPRSS